jgi:hypothetical protein
MQHDVQKLPFMATTDFDPALGLSFRIFFFTFDFYLAYLPA